MKNILTLAATACLWASPLAAQDASDPRETIETALVPVVSFEGEDTARKSIEQRLEELQVPNASVAVYRDGELAWAEAYGDGANSETLFQMASLSKGVAAAGIVALAFERGVGLDDDISGDLTGLDLARLNPEGLPITLRGLLSHTNGATVSGFPGYAAGTDVPTTAQVIEGTGPTNTDPVVIEPNPDGERRYSGGGYTVAQYWAEQVSGESFPALMRRLVLDPLGMERSLFSAARAEDFPRKNVAAALDNEGVPIDGGWNVYPESAAASLWSTPREYGLFVAALMKASAGEEDTGLPVEVAQALVTPVSETYGLGIGVSTIGDAIRLTHSGSNRGYKSNFMAYPASGDLIVSVVNGEPGFPLIGDIGRTANIAYGWPSSPLLVRTRMPATAEELARYAGDYTRDGAGRTIFSLSVETPELVGTIPGYGAFRLVKTGEATFIDPADAAEGTFVLDDQGRMSVTFSGTTYYRPNSED